MKSLLLIAALIASAVGATILYKDVGVHPYATPHALGLGISKQYGESIHSVPWYGQQNKEHLVGVLSGPNYHHTDVDAIGHLAAQLGGALGGLIDTETLQTGPIGVITDADLAQTLQTGPIGVITDADLAQTLQTGPIGVITDADLAQMMHVQHPFGTQWQGAIHGIGDQTGNLYIGEHGELLKGTGVPYQFGQHGVPYQGQYYPFPQVYSHHQIGADEIEALKGHVSPYLTIPISGQALGEMGHDTDDLSTSILYQKLHPTQYMSGSLLEQLIGQHGFGGYQHQFQVPLSQVAVGPYGHSGVIGVQQGKVWPFQTPSAVHQWYWNVPNHHF